MSRFVRKMKTNKFKFIITFVLISILSIAVIGLSFKLNNSLSTETIKASAYSVCQLDDSTGKIAESEGYLVSDFINADGLKCELKKDAEISYRVFAYDENKTFIGATDSLSEDATLSDLGLENIENVKYVRIQIMPLADSNISFIEVSGYVGQLTVTVNK